MATITLNPPEQRNASGDALPPALLDAEQDSDVRVIALTGGGGTPLHGLDCQAIMAADGCCSV